MTTTKRYITAVIELPADAAGQRTVAAALPYGENFHGGKITGLYAGDAIAETELYEVHVGPHITKEVRQRAAALQGSGALASG